MVSNKLTTAIQEAYAYANPDIVILNTIELYHRNFDSAIRVTNNNEIVNAKLETTAPLNGGEYVEFIPLLFEMTEPKIDNNGVPSLTLAISNVSRTVIMEIEKVVSSLIPIEVIFRQYRSDDLATPHYNPPLKLVLTNVTVDNIKIIGTATFKELQNKKFPSKTYTTDVFTFL